MTRIAFIVSILGLLSYKWWSDYVVNAFIRNKSNLVGVVTLTFYTTVVTTYVWKRGSLLRLESSCVVGKETYGYKTKTYFKAFHPFQVPEPFTKVVFSVTPANYLAVSTSKTGWTAVICQSNPKITI